MNLIQADKIYDAIVPIGQDCSVAGGLVLLNYRNCSYPFDWCYCKMSYVNKMFSNNFENFFPKPDELKSYKKTNATNNEESINFFHDGSIKKLKNIEYNNFIKEKYKKRCNRLLDIINNSKNNILFVRINYHLEYEIKECKKLSNIIKDKFKCNFNILLIQRNYNFDNIIEENDNIIIFKYEDYFNKKREHRYLTVSKILSNFKVKKVNNFYNETTQKIIDEVNNSIKKESIEVRKLVNKIVKEIDPYEKL